MRLWSALAASVAALATGCGGGGGTAAPPSIIASPAPTPVPAPAPAPVPTPTPAAFRYEAAADYAIANGSRAVLILRGGQVMLERYANGGGVARGEPIASGTKSFTCLLAAAAEDDGILSIDDRVSTVLAPWAPGGAAPQIELKQQIRGVDLLALTAGLTTTGSFGGDLNGVDTYQQAITATSRAAPNTATLYGPNGFQGFSLFFELKTGGRLNADGSVTGGRDGVAYLQTRVFDRIGLTPTGWARDVRGKPNFGGGAAMTARSWARFGQFMEQSGQWDGQQIVSAARLQRCVDYRSGAFQGYGLAWWLNRPVGASYVPGRDFLPFAGATNESWRAGGRLAPSAPADMYVAAGAGEMRLYVIPSQDLVIVRMAGPEEEDRFFQLLYGSG